MKEEINIHIEAGNDKRPSSRDYKQMKEEITAMFEKHDIGFIQAYKKGFKKQ